MNQEVPDLIVVNTDGSGNIKKKTGPRANFKAQNVTGHTLSNVTSTPIGEMADCSCSVERSDRGEIAARRKRAGIPP
jgi:hypothetical protein